MIKLPEGVKIVTSVTHLCCVHWQKLENHGYTPTHNPNCLRYDENEIKFWAVLPPRLKITHKSLVAKKWVDEGLDVVELYCTKEIYKQLPYEKHESI